MKPVRVVVGILRRGNTVLIAQRPEGKPYSGYWEFPGGKIEDNERSKDALVRELYEELGIDVVNAEPWFQHTHVYPDKTVYLEMWLVSAYSGEPHSKENQALKWATLPAMLEMPLLEGNWPIIDRIKSLLEDM